MSDAGSVQSTLTDFDRLVFRQEINEVYLLLDFISGRPDKRLSDLDDLIRDPENPSVKLSSFSLVQLVSAIRYPSAKAELQTARDAAFLLTLKDRLNWLAYPARGMTIAYTIMFIDAERKKNQKRIVSRLTGQRAVLRAGPDDGLAANEYEAACAAGISHSDGVGVPVEANSSRLHVAEHAFPALINSARSFRRFKDAIAWLALVITVVSAIFLWQVTYGIQLAGRFDGSKHAEDDAAGKIYSQLEKEHAGGAPLHQPDNLTAFCQLKQLAPVGAGFAEAAATEVKSSTIDLLCNDYAYRHALLGTAISDISSYGQSWMFTVSGWLLPVHRVCPPDGCPNGGTQSGAGRQEDAQSVAGVLAMMTNYMLPILFGVVGTMAALVRGIQERVKQSLLAPRDRALSLIRLPLGMMAGIAVGLFINPSTFSAEAGSGIGTMTITAPGLAFLAGYGAEGFFRALDKLIASAFSLENEGRTVG